MALRWVRKLEPDLDEHLRHLQDLSPQDLADWFALVLAYSTLLRRDVTMADVIRAIESGDVNGVLDRMAWGEAATLFITGGTKAMSAALERAGQMEAEYLQLTLKFDLQNPAVYQWIEAHGAELVVEISAETRKAIQGVIRTAYEKGVNPYQSAKVIQTMIGLTERDAKAVFNYWQNVAMDGERSVSAAVKMTETYADKLLKRRSENIALTETVNAAAKGQQLAWEEARSRGFLSSAAMQEWVAAMDGRTCPRCWAMDRQRVPIGEPFMSALGPISGPTLHPRCRCAVSLINETLK